jgi:quinohemoprotein ethanol dehydrogenase
VIGNGGAESRLRGYVSAYDAATGELVWRFTRSRRSGEALRASEARGGAKTWQGGEWWKFGGGGTVWDSIAYDPELDLLYVGTGNGALDRRRSPQRGDNLYLASILALRPDTGELVWHYQTTPGDVWDYTATQHLCSPTSSSGADRARSCCRPRRTDSSTSSTARPASSSRRRATSP